MGATGHSSRRLLAPSPEEAKTIQLIATYTGAADHIEISASKNDVELVDDTGRAIIGSNTICRHLARSSSHSDVLLGADAETAAVVRVLSSIVSASQDAPQEPHLGSTLNAAPMQVSQWMSMRYSLLLPISEEALQTLESHLATRTFILGTALSLADLTLFGALHQAVVGHCCVTPSCMCLPCLHPSASDAFVCSLMPELEKAMQHGVKF